MSLVHQIIQYLRLMLSKYRLHLESPNTIISSSVGLRLFSLLREAETVFATPLMLEFCTGINGVVFGSFLGLGVLSAVAGEGGEGSGGGVGGNGTVAETGFGPERCCC